MTDRPYVSLSDDELRVERHQQLSRYLAAKHVLDLLCEESQIRLDEKQQAMDDLHKRGFRVMPQGYGLS